MKRNVSVVRLIVAIRSSGPPASGKIIKEMPVSVASGTPYSFMVPMFHTDHLWEGQFPHTNTNKLNVPPRNINPVLSLF